MSTRAVLFLAVARAAVRQAHGAAVSEETVYAEPGEGVVLSYPGAALATSWEQLSGPEKLIDGRVQARSLRVNASRPGEYLLSADGGKKVFRLRVREGLTRPVAVAPRRIRAGGGEKVTLDAEGSFDPLGGELRYRWSQEAGPRIELSCRGPRAEFLAARAGEYVFALVVRAGRRRSEPAPCWVTVPFHPRGGPDRRPRARLRAPLVAEPGEEVVLDAKGSFDPDEDPLSWKWSQLSGPPAGLHVSADGTARFTPPGEGEYVFELLVRSAELESRPARARVRVGRRGRPAAEAPTPLERLISVEFRDVPLADVIAKFPREVGLTARVSGRVVRPGELGEVDIDIKVANSPARMLCDWLARTLNAEYVIQGKRRDEVWFDSSSAWLADEPVQAASHRADALYIEHDGSDLKLLCEDVLKAGLWWNGSSFVAVEPASDRLTAILPPSGLKRLARLVSSLRGPPAFGGGFGVTEEPTRFLLRKVSCSHVAKPLRDVLWDAGARAGVSIGYDPSAFPHGAPPLVTMKLGEATLSRVFAEVMRSTPLDGVLFDPPNGLWLYSGKKPYRSMEDLWLRGELRAYDVSRTVSRPGWSASVVKHLIETRIRPQSWRDLRVALHYHAPLRRLVVVHDREVHGEVWRLLRAMRRASSPLEMGSSGE